MSLRLPRGTPHLPLVPPSLNTGLCRRRSSASALPCLACALARESGSLPCSRFAMAATWSAPGWPAPSGPTVPSPRRWPTSASASLICDGRWLPRRTASALPHSAPSRWTYRGRRSTSSPSTGASPRTTPPRGSKPWRAIAVRSSRGAPRSGSSRSAPRASRRAWQRWRDWRQRR
jgi:hypothetical protein